MSEWNRTSHVLAWVQNWSGFSDSTVAPRSLNPFVEESDGPTIDAGDVAVMLCGQAAVEAFAKADVEKMKREDTALEKTPMPWHDGV
jgi:hypothetical protein